MKKFLIVYLERQRVERPEAEEMTIEGAAAVFLKVKTGKVFYERLVVPLSQVKFIGEAPDPDPFPNQ